MDITSDLDATTGVLTVTLDDGAKNALTIEAFEGLVAALDGAPEGTRVIVLTGRDDIFSAGLDVKFMATAGREGIQTLLVNFGRSLMRLWTEPRPTVAAVRGHAVAAGTMYAMACDHTVASDGPHKWGLTETRIDFEMPVFGLELARANVRADRLEDLILPGAMIEAAEAVEVGYADELAPAEDVLEVARVKAVELAALPARAYAGTKARLRAAAAERVLHGLEDDITALLAFLDG